MKKSNKKSNSYSAVNVLTATKAVRNMFLGLFCFMITLTGMAQPSNKCLSFNVNGSNSIVNFLDSDLVLSWNNNLVISAWVNWGNKANAGANAIILAVSDSAENNGQFWLQHNTSNSAFQFVLQTDSLVKDTVNSTTNPVAGSWYNVAGVFDGGNIKIYVNGILEGTTAIPHGQVFNSNTNNKFKMTMGAGSKLTNQFNGLIDEVSIWNQPLVVNQPNHVYTFQTYMCKRITPTAKGLYAYWNMDTLHTDSVYDLIADADGYDEYNAVCSNVTVVQGGAPVGSSVTQLTGTGPFVYINTTTGDTLLIDSLSAAANVVYVYQVNGVPTNTALPYGVSTTCPPYYYGIYIPGYQGTYSVSYYYHTTSCPGYRTTSSSSMVLLNRNPQTSFDWVISNATVDVSGSKFSMVVSGGQNEFLMASDVSNTTGIATLNNSLKITGISPNPFSGNFNLTVNCPKNSNINARMMSADGKLISERILNCNQGENQVTFENMNEIASGIYFLHLNDEEGYTSNLKIVKN
ncbi:MAG: LamG-like jellyroll fold domain-containing protein [Bacteroidia bacterium]